LRTSASSPSRGGATAGPATSCPLTRWATGATATAPRASQPPWPSPLLHPSYPRSVTSQVYHSGVWCATISVDLALTEHTLKQPCLACWCFTLISNNLMSCFCGAEAFGSGCIWRALIDMHTTGRYHSTHLHMQTGFHLLLKRMRRPLPSALTLIALS